MHNDNKIKLSFKGLILEMLTTEKAAIKIASAIYVSSWLFGLAGIVIALAQLVRSFH